MSVIAPMVVAALVSGSDAVAVIKTVTESSDGVVHLHDVAPVHERGYALSNRGHG